jgi:hypothetical protein
MVILMSETRWAHNKWNKIASDIKFVFHSSTIAMMHCPINIRSENPPCPITRVDEFVYPDDTTVLEFHGIGLPYN